MYNTKIIEFAYQWKSILMEENKEYHFPEKITPFMTRTYKRPAIYRWNIFRKKPNDKKLIYIGVAQELCPKRINGYLKPGRSQQTNIRIKEKFQGYLGEGFKIGLEIFWFDNIKIGNFSLTNNDLNEKHVRRFIEELMVIIYKQKGFQILNL